jgi:hypothetical protein
MSGGELKTVATIDGPLRGDFLFSIGSAGEGGDEGWFRTMICPGRICRGRATFNFAAPEHARLSDTYASLSDVLTY